MAAGAVVGENQLQRIIRDLHEAVAELAKEYRETGEPITDDSTNLHKFSYKLEYLLQFDQKEKTTLLGTRKDYWDFFIDCLAKIKGANDGIRFVKSISELKTSLGKGRAFIRYSLVHQRLADTLQQCLMNQRTTSDWYYARSPLVKPHLSVDIISHLYELNEVQFDVASRGHDLDASWPTFARRTLGSPNSPGHMWKPPSRSSSINSLASTYSQQAHELPLSPDYGQSLLSELDESLASCGEDVSAVEHLRLELDQSELRQQGLLSRVQQLGEEAGELRGVVAELQRQLDVSLGAQEDHQNLQAALKALEGREETLSRELELLRSVERAREAEQRLLLDKLAAAEGKSMELLAKLDGVLNEKGQQASSHFDSAQKIHELLDRLKEAESGKMEAVSDMEDKKRQVERLEEELKVKDVALKDREVKLGELVTTTSEETAQLKASVLEECNTKENLAEKLAMKDNEACNLQRKLEDLQRLFEEKDRQVVEVKEKARADEQSTIVLKESLEGEVDAIKELLMIKEAELTSSSKTLQRLESEKDSLTLERDSLTTGNSELETSVKEHSKKTEDYKTQCTNLMEINENLLSTVKRNEEFKKEMVANRGALEAELASLRASDKQLRSQLDDAKVSVDDKEKRLRQENRSLDESLQRAAMAAQLSETTSKRLEQENQALREDRATVSAALSSMQAELKSFSGQMRELEKSLGTSRKNEAALQEQGRAKEAQLESKESELKELHAKVKTKENREKELKKAKAKAEAALARQSEVIERLSTEKLAVEESQLERSSLHARENQGVVEKLVLAEGQLEVNMKDVARLQSEVLDLRVQLQRAGEENLKCQTKLEVTEGQRAEFMSLTEQLQAHTEALNQSHVAELLGCKQKEEVLIEEQVRQAAAHAQELATLKAESARLGLESGETREGVYRANTEMAELGMTICKLTAEKEEARERWTKEAAKIEELQDGATREVERLEACLAALRQENASLRERLSQVESLPRAVVELQQQLGKAEGHVQTLQHASREEMDAVRFQISSESMSHQNQLKSVNEQLTTVKAQLHSESETVSRLQGQVSELEAVNEKHAQLMVEKDSHITKCEATMRHNECEMQQLKEAVSSTEEALTALRTVSEELRERLEKTEAEKQSDHQKMTAEIEDLSGTKTTLEERLIELLRDKDALWQKSDALEFEQKLRAEERWWLVDKEATNCLDCRGHFTWYLRRHHCRLCGRIFCYYCSNNFVTTKHSGKKERCCRECYSQHGDVVERFTRAELGPAEAHTPPDGGAGPESHPQPAPYKPTPRVTVSEPASRPEEGAFDIITEEEVNGVYDSDTVSQTTGGSPESDQDRRPPGPVDIGTGDMTPDNPEDHVATVQDSEINLLRSGEVTVAVALGIDDITHFGDSSRELFVKGSCYSLISIAVGDRGPSIGWVFSSDPKSISFSVVYREGPDTPVEQAKVLIPLTRCNSHRETIQGQLKVRNPGLYTLVFDNSFSRFIGKKVLYHLTIEKPVIYDGSDFP
ncbi:FYVE and coiled-coil domain-containing protein 1 [Gadus morhua]|uniref:FYVE and coiled-coil domain-containing protein 1 n=1 Tax=Gadus morhua TaxID=8049 RepID=A0A8C5A1A7_GADMO|nr:FYVE and coiled-coil domain-containing protein 1 [Gadus morhua]XP_030228474.1 FYVE and coiled-coil domain-containing protein 1 [Gadus morhua]